MDGRQFTLNVWTPGQDPVIGELISLDTETELIVDHHFPDLVLLQVTAGSRVDLVRWEDAHEYMRLLFRYNPRSRYVLVNAAYDMGVLGMPEFYDLVDTRQVIDLMDRYKLWEISERGFVRKPAGLSNMAKNVLGVELPKDDELRLMFTRTKDPSVDQMIYGAKDVMATWLLGLKMPPMPTEADSQIMGSIVLDAISRNGMLVDMQHFYTIRESFQEESAKELEYLEMHGYNPLLGKPSTHVLRAGLEAIGIEIEPQKISGPTMEFLLYKALFWAACPLDEFRQKMRLCIREIDQEETGVLSQKDAVDWYVGSIERDMPAKLKRDRLVEAREHVKTMDLGEVLAATRSVRVNPFKPKPRARINELLRDLLDEKFTYDNGIDTPLTVRGVGLKEMARDTTLALWPMASVFRDLCRAKAGQLECMPEFDWKRFCSYTKDKSVWYGDYSTEWKDCMKPEAFMQARLLSIERKNPDVVFPRTDGGKTGKNKKIQLSGKDRWILKKYGIKDELLETFVSYKHNEKLISTYLNPAHVKADGRVHTRYENYVRTGRTSSAKPNVQNVPGSGGIRQMYLPAPMHLYASVDYSQLELCSLAQHCYVVYGFSRMRDLINANIDLHSWFAAKTSGLLAEENDYDGTEESRLYVIELIKGVKTKDRKNAKAANFGFPGGMSAETFLRTQRGYGNIEITIEECQDLRDKWFEAFPEMKLHMQPTSDVVTEYDRIRFDNPNLRLNKATNIAGVLRRKCTFNSACNFPFQSLAAVGAKRALWAVWRDGRYAKYMVNFIHDEILFELPAETAVDDVREIQKIMEDAMKEVIPDVRIEAEGCLMERWDKEAEPVYDELGNLTVWYPEEEAA